MEDTVSLEMTLQGGHKEATASRVVGTATLQFHHVPMRSRLGW
jgi:hypothetical protein